MCIRDRGNKILVTTLTKRMAEDLTDYMKQLDIKVKYLHSDIDTLERLEIVRDLRMGVFDAVSYTHLRMYLRESGGL